MLRISEIETTNGTARLALEGRMTGPWVSEVRGVCQQFLRKGRRLSLDLAQLSFVDREGVSLLRKLITDGVALTNCSPFIAERLKEVGADDD
jgi:ABC-type transporter Mla MlaB component